MNGSHFEIVGRDGRIDLSKYTVQVHGRDVIDYEKLKTEDPALYRDIVANEFVADRRDQAETAELLARPDTPPESIRSSANPEEPAIAKYFYHPVFVTNPREGVDHTYELDMLAYTHERTGGDAVYASRVMPGQTLREAIAHDLQHDFSYDGEFSIWARYDEGTAGDQHGTPLPRLAVLVKVGHFPTEGLSSAGLSVAWRDDGAARIRDYQFEDTTTVHG